MVDEVKMTNIKDLQRALKGHGFDPGEIDGVWGRKSIAATKAFQTANGLTVDGVVGPKTTAALFKKSASAATDPAPLVWLEEARRLQGLRETPGGGNNPAILNWAGRLGIPYRSDDIPWCGLFVAHCIGSTLPEEVLPRSPLTARAWAFCGESCEPGLGSILVFWRGSKTGVLGHVGFYIGEDETAYHVLGGNQSDSVNVARVAKNRLLDARWPRTGSFLNRQVIALAATGELSTQEA